MNKNLNFIDLFAGCGGFSLGLEFSGFTPIFVNEISNEAMQVMGGTGYSQESLVEYCFRKSRGWQIAGGSTEMMKNRIAEDIFGRRFSQRPNK